MTDAGLDWQQEAVFFCQLPLPLGLLYPVNQPKLVIEKPGGPLPLPQLPQDDGEVPAVKQAAREKAPLGDSSTDDHQVEDVEDLTESIDISHKFKDLFENDDIFSDIEDLDNFEIFIREVPENFEGIKDVLKTPVSSLTVPALAEKFMTDLENKEKDFNEEANKNDKNKEDVIDLSKLDLFNDFIDPISESSGLASVTEKRKKDKRNPGIFIVCITLIK